LFFNATDAPVPQDVNRVEDAYEFEPPGVGGRTMVFLMAASLSLRDFDTALEVYDAHVCTGASPCLRPSAIQPPERVTQASCRPAPSPQSAIFDAPASATCSGTGSLSPAFATTAASPNAKSKNCTEGLVRRHNACVPAKNKRRVRKAANTRRVSA
jgi:hypothetical protein